MSAPSATSDFSWRLKLLRSSRPMRRVCARSRAVAGWWTLFRMRSVSLHVNACHTCAPYVRRPDLKIRPTYDWRFYIFSGRSTAGERAICECDIEFLQQLRMFDHLFSQQGDEIEARRSMRASSPLGQGCIGGPPLSAKGEQGCQQQGTIGRDREDRLLGDRDRIPQLGLAHTQRVLLVAMVDFDLPAVEIDLQQRTRATPQVGGQQIGGVSVVAPGTLAFAVGRGRDDEEAQR